MTNTAVVSSLDRFNRQVINSDMQRTNLFSINFATTPKSKSQEYLGALESGHGYDDSIAKMLKGLGVSNPYMQSALSSIITIGTQKIVRRSGVSKILLGAMSSRVVQSLLGELKVGSYLLDYFDTNWSMAGLLVQSCKIPDNTLTYDMDRMHNSPNIKITGRSYEPLVVTFRMDSDSANHRAFNDWVNAIEDPYTGLRALPVDIEADIQVNLHNRNGYPHTAIMFSGCVPVVVSGPQLSYEDNNQISTFDVTFAYRTMGSSAVSEQSAKAWVSDMTMNLFSTSQQTTSRLK